MDWSIEGEVVWGVNILLDLHRGTDNGIVKNNPKGEGRLRIISQRVGRRARQKGRIELEECQDVRLLKDECIGDDGDGELKARWKICPGNGKFKESRRNHYC